MPTSPGLVAILAYDGLCTFEFGIAVEVFGLTRPEFDFPWYTHAIAAVDQGPMRAMGGIQVLADGGMAVLLCEQYYDFAEELADEYLVMERGEVIAHGPGSEMQEKGIQRLVAI